MSGIANFFSNTFSPGIDMSIEFDNSSGAYYVGQNVTGRLILRLQKEKKFRNITVNSKGEAYVRWKEYKYTKNYYYTGHEEYFTFSVVVAGGTAGDETLGPGEYSYPFNFALPENIPSSFEGQHGHIRYTVRGVMDRPWKFDHECKTAFTVVAPLDLNITPNVKEPVVERTSKSLWCWCFQSGPLEVSAELPCSGFVPGQTIPLKVNVENNSNVPVDSVKCILQQKLTWTSTSPRHHTPGKAVVVKNEINERIEANSSKTFVQNIEIPAVPPSNLQNCNLIDLEYILKVIADSGSFHKKARVRIPITLGTVPLQIGKAEHADIPDHEGITSPTDPLKTPSAPPLYPDLPPPSFEESVFGGTNIKDENDGQHTQGTSNFTPRYPVWNFNQQ